MTNLSIQSGTPTTRVAVLLLAAGEGSRLGGYPKALLKKDDQTLLEHLVISTKSMAPIEFVAVTGFYAEAIEGEIDRLNRAHDLNIKTCLNPYPEKGQSSSIRLGLESLQSAFDVLFVALSDQPEIGCMEISELLEGFTNRPPGTQIVLPMVGKQRGNPVLFSKGAVDEILAISQMVCRSYMDANPALIYRLDTNRQAFIQDVDTPKDISKYQLSKS
ncbi:NTP transferase domain-containing protein [Polynucleobacter brandtiae]|uniref:Molybdenum cofactor cytidylyltransferase/nicotine blue oxidoreductase n=1 Tax=Polynucleobacter brandtiae TaxID=1938816 RepID=A0A2M8VXZ2_9BURK|nr:nucleotidyltransferase family protein [Polynucleobacter brandtiae]PJI82734.1 molybdenum cofactor cytidylyltransferase/nicotine blue oxidoreductase [Polynucleobacter brandtiae]